MLTTLDLMYGSTRIVGLQTVEVIHMQQHQHKHQHDRGRMKKLHSAMGLGVDGIVLALEYQNDSDLETRAQYRHWIVMSEHQSMKIMFSTRKMP